MPFGRSDRVKNRHSRQGTGDVPAANHHDPTRQPQYMIPAGAVSTQAIHTTQRPPPVPFQHPHTATASLVRLPPQVSPGSPPPPLPGRVAWNGIPTQQSKPPGLAKWTSYSQLSQSVTDLVSHTTGKANATIMELENLVLQSMTGGKNVRESTTRLLDQVVTSIDIGSFCGKEKELLTACTLPFRSDERKYDRRSQRTGKQKPSGSIDYFSKVYLYANSRMPPNLPPLKFYRATYPLLQLAAQYSRRVYHKPNDKERESYVNSDWLQGTKAMVIKSLPVDDLNTIVFAIRGTQSFMDWAVNVNTAPVAPAGFLDDASNCCHAGFLNVARKMVGPVAARLRALIEEDPGRMSYSLLITGHSAGGAVASLLYLHLLSESPLIVSELTHLRGCFKNIHCVTFGAPPVSLRPLIHTTSTRKSKSMFFAFVNEGDPVTRADKGYFFSLLDLYASPAPGSLWSLLDWRSKPRPIVNWKVPPTTLSNAGRLVLLRARDQPNGRPPVLHPGPGGVPATQPRERIEAFGTTDADLRGIAFGDPLMHLMDLYARRIDALAFEASGGKSRYFMGFNYSK
ncbi:hypothetical protein N7492_003143 [Penicillium capsulatum]|uniref:Fungal lipase-type domain-containing protein n=1 Tax=Penicillium capsulatum TaxID=69766 RepID=A0A9W9LVX1_9EURO|nr:hypothetical protein N7492_003143 [Penicillium capsulatum]KAJ6122267.1 hypothetical protein N7512_004732 [Penicillium capsulatum]